MDAERSFLEQNIDMGFFVTFIKEFYNLAPSQPGPIRRCPRGTSPAEWTDAAQRRSRRRCRRSVGNPDSPSSPTQSRGRVDRRVRWGLHLCSTQNNALEQKLGKTVPGVFRNKNLYSVYPETCTQKAILLFFLQAWNRKESLGCDSMAEHRTCSMVQKMWASSCWKRRTRVSPVRVPESSLRCSTPKSASLRGSSLHDRGRWQNIRLGGRERECVCVYWE